MKRRAPLLAVICALCMLMNLLVVQAQESRNKTIAQLKVEIERLEAIANDPSTSPEVKEINQGFLLERREQLRGLVARRLDALRSYKATVGDSLSQDEHRVLNASIRDLENLLQNSGGSKQPGSPATLASNPTEIASLGTIPVSYLKSSSPATDSFNAMPSKSSDIPESSSTNIPLEKVASPIPRPELATAPAPAPTPKPTISVDVATEQATGDKIRGPATIEFKNLNVLRYDIRVGKDVTFTPGPDLKLPFIPPIPTQPAKANAAGAAGGVGIAGPDPIPPAFNALVGQVNMIEGEKVRDVNNVIVAAINRTNSAKNNLEALVSASDSILTTGGGPAAIIGALTPLIGTRAAPGGEIDLALSYSWPDAKIEDLLGRLDILKNSLLTLPTTPGGSWTAWYTDGNKAAYDAIVARVGELQTQLNNLKSNSTQGTAFRDAQNKLRLWKPILIGVRDGGTAGFKRIVKVGCSFAFDSNKETKIKIVKRDRLADANTAPASEEIVTVVCSSPLTVSAGFGFSNVEEREFVFVPSTKAVTTNGQTTQTVINRFGFKNNSSFRTLPVLLLNTRFWEPNDTFAFHASTGAAVDIKTGQGGTDLEFIVGPSISFRRSLFITPGLHIGRVPKLAGGFSLDEEVPTGISEPPVEKSWKRAFVTTFTYKIR